MLIIKIRKMSSSANFLWSAANLLPTDNRAQILLKSYYLYVQLFSRNISFWVKFINLKHLLLIIIIFQDKNSKGN